MAFVHQPLGALVATNPQAAHAQLAELFAEHKTRAAVSLAIQVDARTIARWITRLMAEGHGDPRGLPPLKATRPEKKIAKKAGKKQRPKRARKKVVAR